LYPQCRAFCGEQLAPYVLFYSPLFSSLPSEAIDPHRFLFARVLLVGCRPQRSVLHLTGYIWIQTAAADFVQELYLKEIKAYKAPPAVRILL
jgi:hypothetical protein